MIRRSASGLFRLCAGCLGHRSSSPDGPVERELLGLLRDHLLPHPELSGLSNGSDFHCALRVLLDKLITPSPDSRIGDDAVDGGGQLAPLEQAAGAARPRDPSADRRHITLVARLVARLPGDLPMSYLGDGFAPCAVCMRVGGAHNECRVQLHVYESLRTMAGLDRGVGIGGVGRPPNAAGILALVAFLERHAAGLDALSALPALGRDLLAAARQSPPEDVEAALGRAALVLHRVGALASDTAAWWALVAGTDGQQDAPSGGGRLGALARAGGLVAERDPGCPLTTAGGLAVALAVSLAVCPNGGFIGRIAPAALGTTLEAPSLSFSLSSGRIEAASGLAAPPPHSDNVIRRRRAALAAIVRGAPACPTAWSAVAAALLPALHEMGGSKAVTPNDVALLWRALWPPARAALVSGAGGGGAGRGAGSIDAHAVASAVWALRGVSACFPFTPLDLVRDAEAALSAAVGGGAGPGDESAGSTAAGTISEGPLWDEIVVTWGAALDTLRSSSSAGAAAAARAARSALDVALVGAPAARHPTPMPTQRARLGLAARALLCLSQAEWTMPLRRASLVWALGVASTSPGLAGPAASVIDAACGFSLSPRLSIDDVPCLGIALASAEETASDPPLTVVATRADALAARWSAEVGAWAAAEALPHVGASGAGRSLVLLSFALDEICGSRDVKSASETAAVAALAHTSARVWSDAVLAECRGGRVGGEGSVADGDGVIVPGMLPGRLAQRRIQAESACVMAFATLAASLGAVSEPSRLTAGLPPSTATVVRAALEALLPGVAAQAAKAADRVTICPVGGPARPDMLDNVGSSAPAPVNGFAVDGSTTTCRSKPSPPSPLLRAVGDIGDAAATLCRDALRAAEETALALIGLSESRTFSANALTTASSGRVGDGNDCAGGGFGDDDDCVGGVDGNDDGFDDGFGDAFSDRAARTGGIAQSLVMTTQADADLGAISSEDAPPALVAFSSAALILGAAGAILPAAALSWDGPLCKAVESVLECAGFPSSHEDAPQDALLTALTDAACASPPGPDGDALAIAALDRVRCHLDNLANSDAYGFVSTPEREALAGRLAVRILDRLAAATPTANAVSAAGQAAAELLKSIGGVTAGGEYNLSEAVIVRVEAARAAPRIARLLGAAQLVDRYAAVARLQAHLQGDHAYAVRAAAAYIGPVLALFDNPFNVLSQFHLALPCNLVHVGGGEGEGSSPPATAWGEAFAKPWSLLGQHADAIAREASGLFPDGRCATALFAIAHAAVAVPAIEDDCLYLIVASSALRPKLRPTAAALLRMVAAASGHASATALLAAPLLGLCARWASCGMPAQLLEDVGRSLCLTSPTDPPASPPPSAAAQPIAEMTPGLAPFSAPAEDALDGLMALAPAREELPSLLSAAAPHLVARFLALGQEAKVDALAEATGCGRVEMLHKALAEILALAVISSELVDDEDGGGDGEDGVLATALASTYGDSVSSLGPDASRPSRDVLIATVGAVLRFARPEGNMGQLPGPPYVTANRAVAAMRRVLFRGEPVDAALGGAHGAVRVILLAGSALRAAAGTHHTAAALAGARTAADLVGDSLLAHPAVFRLHATGLLAALRAGTGADAVAAELRAALAGCPVTNASSKSADIRADLVGPIVLTVVELHARDVARSSRGPASSSGHWASRAPSPARVDEVGQLIADVVSDVCADAEDGDLREALRRIPTLPVGPAALDDLRTEHAMLRSLSPVSLAEDIDWMRAHAARAGPRTLPAFLRAIVDRASSDEDGGRPSFESSWRLLQTLQSVGDPAAVSAAGRLLALAGPLRGCASEREQHGLATLVGAVGTIDLRLRGNDDWEVEELGVPGAGGGGGEGVAMLPDASVVEAILGDDYAWVPSALVVLDACLSGPCCMVAAAAERALFRLFTDSGGRAGFRALDELAASVEGERARLAERLMAFAEVAEEESSRAIGVIIADDITLLGSSVDLSSPEVWSPRTRADDIRPGDGPAGAWLRRIASAALIHASNPALRVCAPVAALCAPLARVVLAPAFADAAAADADSGELCASASAALQSCLLNQVAADASALAPAVGAVLDLLDALRQRYEAALLDRDAGGETDVKRVACGQTRLRRAASKRAAAVPGRGSKEGARGPGLAARGKKRALPDDAPGRSGPNAPPAAFLAALATAKRAPIRGDGRRLPPSTDARLARSPIFWDVSVWFAVPLLDLASAALAVSRPATALIYLEEWARDVALKDPVAQDPAMRARAAELLFQAQLGCGETDGARAVAEGAGVPGCNHARARATLALVEGDWTRAMLGIDQIWRAGDTVADGGAGGAAATARLPARAASAVALQGFGCSRAALALLRGALLEAPPGDAAALREEIARASWRMGQWDDTELGLGAAALGRCRGPTPHPNDMRRHSPPATLVQSSMIDDGFDGLVHTALCALASGDCDAHSEAAGLAWDEALGSLLRSRAEAAAAVNPLVVRLQVASVVERAWDLRVGEDAALAIGQARDGMWPLPFALVEPLNAAQTAAARAAGRPDLVADLLLQRARSARSAGQFGAVNAALSGLRMLAHSEPDQGLILSPPPPGHASEGQPGGGSGGPLSVHPLSQTVADHQSSVRAKATAARVALARPDSAWRIEECRTLWATGERAMAVTALGELSAWMAHAPAGECSPVVQAAVLSERGFWAAEQGTENSAVVLDDYYGAAVRRLGRYQRPPPTGVHEHLGLAERADAAREGAIAQWRLASYAGRLYAHLAAQADSPDWARRVAAARDKRSQVARLERRLAELKRRDPPPSATARSVLEHDIRWNKHQIKEISKIVILDDAAQQTHVKSRDRYLRLALAACAGTLMLGGDPVRDLQAVFKLVRLWFAHRDEREINELISREIAAVPSAKLLPLDYQIASRLGARDSGGCATSPARGASSSSGFALLVARLVTQMSRDHPHHVLWHVVSLSNGDRQGDGQRRRHATIQGGLERLADDAKVDAAANVLQQIQAETGSYAAGVAREMLSITEVYIHIGLMAVPKTGRSSEPPPISLPQALRLQVQGLSLPPVSRPVRIEPTGGNAYRGLAHVVSFEPQISFVGGINAPKLVRVLCSDGSRIQELVKSGNDDLRQDAVMQQLFGLINILLRADPAASQRRLGVRTYRCVPFTPSCGLVGWVPNSRPLGEWLVGPSRMAGAHLQYLAPDDWDFVKCYHHVKNGQDAAAEAGDPSIAVERFREANAHFPPVLHRFFLKRYPVPHEWLSRRLSYTRSVAASSFAGHLLGLGDRHMANILVDQGTAEVIHIDLGIAFEQGRVLTTPEKVPFRMTDDIVDGMGVLGVDGPLRACMEQTARVLRSHRDAILTVVGVFVHDPLYKWTITAERASKAQRRTHGGDGADAENGGRGGTATATPLEAGSAAAPPADATRAISRVQAKLDGTDFDDGEALPVEGQVQRLLRDARDPANLAHMFSGWSAWV